MHQPQWHSLCLQRFKVAPVTCTYCSGFRLLSHKGNHMASMLWMNNAWWIIIRCIRRPSYWVWLESTSGEVTRGWAVFQFIKFGWVGQSSLEFVSPRYKRFGLLKPAPPRDSPPVYFSSNILKLFKVSWGTLLWIAPDSSVLCDWRLRHRQTHLQFQLNSLICPSPGFVALRKTEGKGERKKAVPRVVQNVAHYSAPL